MRDWPEKPCAKKLYHQFLAKMNEFGLNSIRPPRRKAQFPGNPQAFAESFKNRRPFGNR